MRLKPGDMEGGRRAVATTLALTLAALIFGGVFASLAPVRRLEAELLDVRFRLRGPVGEPAPVTLVLIDDRSIAALGRWPWSRAILAEGIERLHQGGAEAIGLDLLLTEPEAPPLDPAMTARVAAALIGSNDPDSLGLLRRALDPDGMLAKAMQSAGNVVLPDFLERGRGSAAEVPETVRRGAIARSFSEPKSPVAAEPALHGNRMIAPIDRLGRAAAALGHVNLVLTPEGTAPFDYPAVGVGGNYYPSFALALAAIYLDAPRGAVRIDAEGLLHLGASVVAADRLFRLLVPYAPADRYRSYSFVDLLAGRVPARDLQGQIVLIGADAVGVRDSVTTPFDADLPGIERHAMILEALLRGEGPRRPDWAFDADVAWIAAGGLLIAGALRLSGVLAGALTLAAVEAAIGAVGFLAFLGPGLWLNIAAPALMVLGIGGIGTLEAARESGREARIIRRAFKRYLHPDLVERLARDPDQAALGGEEKTLTVLFADIRGFTGLTEHLPPDRLVGLLNRYFEAMTAAVLAEDGWLDKYTGDGFMAIFGAPVFHDDHAARALRAALSMQAALARLNLVWRDEGYPEIRIGMGINTGPMIIGNVGSMARFNYTAIGDAVNLAARLEAENKILGTTLLMSRAARDAAGISFQTRALGTIMVRGKQAGVEVFELIGMNAEKPAKE